MNRPRRRCPAGENLGRARGEETNAGGGGGAQRGAAGVTVTTSTGFARRVTPVGVSSDGEEGWKREYDWFVRVAIHGGRRCRLESALFLDPERSVLLVSREKREEDVGEAEDVEDPFRRRPQREHRGRERRRTSPADQPARLDGRRDALRHLYRRRPSSPSLLSASHFTPPKWEKETILQFLRPL